MTLKIPGRQFPLAVVLLYTRVLIMKKSILFLATISVLGACGGGMSDKVIARSDELSSRPSWVKDDNPVQVKNGDMFVTSMATVRSDSANIAQGYRIAENQAKTDLSNAIKTEIKTNFVDAQEGVVGDQFRTEFLSIEKSEIAFSGLMPANRYWEKVLVTTADGDKEMEYRFYARMKIKESDFKKQMKDYLNGNKGLSPEFNKRVTQTVNEFTLSHTTDVAEEYEKTDMCIVWCIGYD